MERIARWSTGFSRSLMPDSSGIIGIPAVLFHRINPAVRPVETGVPTGFRLNIAIWPSAFFSAPSAGTKTPSSPPTLKRQNAKTSNPFFILIILCIPNLFKKSALSAKSACHKTPKIKNYLLAGEINRHNDQAIPHLLDFQLNRDWI